MRTTLPAALFLVALAGVVLHCGPSPESIYAAQQMRCVDEAKTRAESQACRQRVDREWGIIQYTGDAGR